MAILGALVALIAGLPVGMALYLTREYTRGMKFTKRDELPCWSRRNGWILPYRWRQHRWPPRQMEDDSI